MILLLSALHSRSIKKLHVTLENEIFFVEVYFPRAL